LNNHKQIYAISYYYTLAENVQLVNQLNYYSSRKKNTLLNYQQYDIKTGVYYLLPKNWQVSLSLQYQFKSFNNYNPLLNKKREDNGFVFTTTIKNKAPIIWGFYPAIELSYTRRLSNVDWLYQYQQHEVLFKLEKQF
ncbi:TPA: surface lipoprotein assembly modifier, partial [Proteus mirabilis]